MARVVGEWRPAQQNEQEVRDARRARSFFERLDLSAQTVAALANLAAEFKGVPPGQRSERSRRQQAISLAKIEDAAARLRGALHAIRNGEFIRFDCSLFEVAPWLMGHADDGLPDEDRFLGGLIHALDVVAALERAAAAAADAIPNSGAAGGRPTTRGFFQSLVSCIAFVVVRDGIKPSRAPRSRFMRVCRAVFAAADIETDPEGYVRTFISEGRPGMRERRLCL